MPNTKETAADEIDDILRHCVPNTRAVVCATDADREALLTELAGRCDAAGHHMMTIVPPADDEAGWRLRDEIEQEANKRHVLLVVDRAAEVLPANGEPGQQSLFYWDVQESHPVLLLTAMAEAALDRHFGYTPLYWP